MSESKFLVTVCYEGDEPFSANDIRLGLMNEAEATLTTESLEALELYVAREAEPCA